MSRMRLDFFFFFKSLQDASSSVFIYVNIMDVIRKIDLTFSRDPRIHNNNSLESLKIIMSTFYAVPKAPGKLYSLIISDLE